MGQYKRLFDYRLYLGVVLVGIISLPWIYAVEQYHPNFAYYYIVVQQILRYSTDEQNRQVLKIVYLLAFIGALFPWTFFLPQVIKQFLSKKSFKERKQDYNKWFLLVWASFIFIFFGISKSFLFGYLAPVVLPLGILIAMHLKSLIDNNEKFTKASKISFGIPIFLFSLFPIVTVVVLCLPMYRSHIGVFMLYMIPIGIVSLIVTIKAIRALKDSNIKRLIILFSLMMIVIANFGYSIGEYFDYSNTRKIADDVNQIYKKYPNTQVYESNRYYDVIFYTKKNVIIIDDEGELDDVASFPNSGVERQLMSYDKFIKHWNNSDSLSLLIVKNKPKKHSFQALKDYKSKIDTSKFFVLDETKDVTLVASKDISI